jgi:hypothetical protein
MANQYFTGTLTPSTLVRGSSGNTYGTHHSVLGVGGFMELKTISERNALPIDNVNGIYYDTISSGQRRLGMLVYVYETQSIYQLKPPVLYSVWNGYTSLQRQTILSDNSNWNLLFTVSGDTNSSYRIYKQFTKTTHGYICGDVIGFDPTLDDFLKSTTTNAITAEPIGIISEVIDINNFNLTYSGYVTTTGMTDISGNTLTAGYIYYVSNVAGKLTKIQPQGLNEKSKPMLVTLLDGKSGIVLQYNGSVKINDGVSYGIFSGYTGNTQQFLNKAVTGGTNLGMFTGTTGIQWLKMSILTPSSGYYYNLFNNYYRDNNGIIQIGIPPYDNIPRQGYLRNVLPNMSWVWNEYTGNTNQIGWIFVDGNISQKVGLFVTGETYTGTVFTQTGWTNGGYYNNGGNLIIIASGSTTTGSSYNNQGPIYENKYNHNLQFRTLKSKNSAIAVTYDNNFIYLSGATGNVPTGATNGLSIANNNVVLGGTLNQSTYINGNNNILKYAGISAFNISAVTIQLNTQKNSLIFDTGTTFSDISVNPIGIQYAADYSATYTNRSLVDKAYVNNYYSNYGVTILSATTYYILNTDQFIGVRTAHVGGSGGVSNLFLPSIPSLGHKLTVADIDGGGALYNVNIWGSGGILILNWSSAAINTNFGSISFLYNGFNWSVTAFTSAPSYS